MNTQPPENPILTVVKSAKTVNKKGQPDRFADRLIDRLGIVNYRLVKIQNVRNKDSSAAADIQIPLFLTGCCLIDYEIISDDGLVENRYFVLIGKTTKGHDLPPIKVSTEKFAGMAWPMQWGNQMIVAPGNGNKDNARAAIQILSGDVRVEREYRHTGWRLIDAKEQFLTGSGAISAEGFNDNIRVDLDKMEQYRLPAPTSEVHQFSTIVRELIGISRKSPTIGAVIMCAVCRAPLANLACIDYSIFLSGQSGNFKSELAALALGFFGDFTSRTFPANFTDTEADMLFKAHQAKDVVFVVDEFCPATSQKDANVMHSKAEALFRSAGNQSGRGRRNADMSGKAAYHPRGMVIATGEDNPRGASLNGRMLIVELKEGDIEKDNLTALQQRSIRGDLQALMAAYVQWLASRLDELKQDFPKKQLELRKAAIDEGFAKSHTRAPDTYASMLAGFDLFLNFLNEVGAISETGALELYDTIQQSLKTTIKAQKEFQDSNDNVKVFRELLQSCFLSGRVHVADRLTQQAPKAKPAVWGWRALESGGEVVGRGTLIGWVDEPTQQLLLDPAAAFSEVKKLASAQDEPFLLSRATLCKRLMERNQLLEVEKDNSTGKDRPTVKRSIGGKNTRVLVFSSDFIRDSKDD